MDNENNNEEFLANGEEMEEFSTIVMTDEDGNEVEYLVVDEFEHKGTNYVVMMLEEFEEEENVEAVIFKQIIEEGAGDELVYEEISEEEYNDIEEVLRKRLAEFDIDME
ncbi:MAG: DUF1292 domain-containing protein [Defluviitaleaceae bacterium]|nr:DUF1292 domain-containing protein [Defluviitaleaceae bacterium]